ncbi:MAG: helix-turn-helix domain-containing protein [Comamonadaceae bacterium]|nr:helix-turn-helix domain-containing protein [Comamonadaceae bacterium]
MSRRLETGITIIRALSGHEFDGLRLAQIASACQRNAPTTLRTLQELEALGIVQRDARREEVWRLGPALVQIAIAFQQHLLNKQRELADFERNYTRTP